MTVLAVFVLIVTGLILGATALGFVVWLVREAVVEEVVEAQILIVVALLALSIYGFVWSLQQVYGV